MKKLCVGILSLMLAAAGCKSVEPVRDSTDTFAEKIEVLPAEPSNPKLLKVWKLASEENVSISRINSALRVVNSVLAKEPDLREAVQLKAWLLLLKGRGAEDCAAYSRLLSSNEYNNELVKELCNAAFNEAINSDDAALQIAALRALANLPPEIACKWFERALAAPSLDVRQKACRIAAELQAKPMIEAIKTSLVEEDELTRAVAAEALARLGDSSGGEIAVELLRVSDRDSAREAAINTIGLCGAADKATIDRLHKAVGDNNLNVHNAAIIALLRLKDPVGQQELNDAMNDQDPTIRRWAAGILGSFKHPNARDWLIKRLTEDKDDGVRIQAAISLGNMGDKAAAAGLKAALKDVSWDVRVRAARSLDILGEQPDIRVYHVGLLDDSFIAKTGSVEGLAARGGAKNVLRLAGQLSSPDRGVRIAVLRAIDKAAGKGALPHLAASLADSDDVVRLTATALILQEASK